MAKYEDYAAKYQNDLQSEIDTASAAQADRVETPENSFEVPESVAKRFAGKSEAEILQSYGELENKLSTQGADLGTLRRTVDEFMTLQSQSVTQEETPTIEPVTVDEIYDDPDVAIRRAVREELEGSHGSRIEQLEQQLAGARTDARLTSLDGKHPGWRETAQSADFKEWVEGSSYRVRMAQSADQHADVDSAEALLDMYAEVKGLITNQEAEARETQLQNASLETGGPQAAPADGDTFSRQDLMNARIAAKQGNMEADTWLRRNAEAIAIAYETPGAIVD